MYYDDEIWGELLLKFFIPTFAFFCYLRWFQAARIQTFENLSFTFTSSNQKHYILLTFGAFFFFAIPHRAKKRFAIKIIRTIKQRVMLLNNSSDNIILNLILHEQWNEFKVWTRLSIININLRSIWFLICYTFTRLAKIGVIFGRWASHIKSFVIDVALSGSIARIVFEDWTIPRFWTTVFFSFKNWLTLWFDVKPCRA